MGVILVTKIWFATGRPYLTWDEYVYLLNGRAWLEGVTISGYFEVLRPPLYPLMIAVVWTLLLGENYDAAAAIQPIFTFGAAVLLYFLVKERFDEKAGFVASVGFLLIPLVFFNTDRILVHGVGTFFVTLSVFCLWRAARSSPVYYALAGASAALGAITRYPDVLIVIPLAFYALKDIRRVRRLKSTGQLGSSSNPLPWFVIGIVVFVLVWTPLLWWSYTNYGDPFISVKLAEISGLPADLSLQSAPTWHFYLDNLPSILSVPGIGLLAAGLVSRNWLKDERRQILAIWFAVFLLFYSAIQNQTLRFMIEWIPPLMAFVGVGVSSIFSFLKNRIPKLRWLFATGVGIWLITLLMGSLALSIPALSFAAYQNAVISQDGFHNTVSWLEQHMSASDIGLSDISPYFAYYTHRYFYDWEYVISESRARGLSIQQFINTLHIKYAVLRTPFAANNGIATMPFLKPIQEFTGYTIYQVA